MLGPGGATSGQTAGKRTQSTALPGRHTSRRSPISADRTTEHVVTSSKRPPSGNPWTLEFRYSRSPPRRSPSVSRRGRASLRRPARARRPALGSLRAFHSSGRVSPRTNRGRRHTFRRRPQGQQQRATQRDRPFRTSRTFKTSRPADRDSPAGPTKEEREGRQRDSLSEGRRKVAEVTGPTARVGQHGDRPSERDAPPAGREEGKEGTPPGAVAVAGVDIGTAFQKVPQ